MLGSIPSASDTRKLASQVEFIQLAASKDGLAAILEDIASRQDAVNADRKTFIEEKKEIEDNLAAREEELQTRSTALEAQLHEVNQRLVNVEGREEAVHDKALELENREDRVKADEESVAQKLKEVEDQKRALSSEQAKVAEAKQEFARKEALLDGKIKEVEDKLDRIGKAAR